MEEVKIENQQIFNLSEEVYTSYYCEENVYKLCEKFIHRIKPESGNLNPTQHQVFAVFITSPNRETFVKCQKSGDPKKDHLVIWDYHVICVHKDLVQNITWVYDFDSTLQPPIKFEEYFIKSLLKKYPHPTLQTLYRVVEANTLVNMFASNRDHMVKKVINGVKLYLKSPPEYPCLVNTLKETNNLFSFYLNIKASDNKYGNDFITELSLSTFFKKYQLPSPTE